MKRNSLFGLLVAGILFSANGQQSTDTTTLKAFARAMKLKAEQQRLEAAEFASKNQVPSLMPTPDGSSKWLHHIENGIPVYYTIRNNSDALASIKTNRLHPGGSLNVNLTGSGMEVSSSRARLGMWEPGAARISHQEFGGRASVRDSAFFTTSNGNTEHATHVACSMIGSGVNPNARGGAYQAKLDCYDAPNDISEMTQAAAEGMLVSNHSYGASPAADGLTNGYYSDGCRDIDSMCLLAPFYLPLYAAGNDRDESSGKKWDLLTDVSNAKNTIQVGAVKILGASGYTGPASVEISDFSSFGPTDDGRIKPDFVSPGVEIFSAISESDSSYKPENGTSMASPLSAGSLFLLQQHYKTKKGVFMKAATLKALAIHTAEEAGPNPGPDYMYGFGLLNMESAIEVINNKGSNYSVSEEVLMNDSTYRYNFTAPGNERFKVTLAWADRPGTPTVPVVRDDRTSKLVHDLDVRIVDQNSGNPILEMPWKLNPAYPDSAATMGDNTVDNVEVINVNSLPAGNYSVVVTHKGTLSMDQPFSLIVTGLRKTVSARFKPKTEKTCVMDTVEYIYDDLDSTSTFSWNFGANATPATANTVGPHYVVYSAPGKKTVSLTITEDSLSDTETMDFVVTDAPAKPSVSASGNVLSSSVTGSKYAWYFNGTAISGATSKDYTATQSGNYTVMVTNSSNCSSTSDAFNHSMSNVRDINTANTTLQVYPNPSRDELFVTCNADNIKNIQVVNTLGKQVLNQVASGKNIRVDVSGVSEGIYELLIQTEAGVFSRKIMINRN